MKSTWAKIILFALPFLILLFFYIAHQQHKQHKTIKKQSLAFNRDWNDFNYQFTGKKAYKKRAEVNQKKLNDMRKKPVEKKKVIKNRDKQLNNDMKSLG